MAAKLHAKSLKYRDEHQDCCFLSTSISDSDSLHLIIAKKYGISVHCIDTDYEDDVNTNCVIDYLCIDSQMAIKQIRSVHGGRMMENVLKRNLNPKYESYYSILCEWDSILILFENAHFCWFYIDIYNEIITDDNNNNAKHMILWLIAPNTNHKYDEFLHELHSRSLSLSLHIHDWRMELQPMHCSHALILAIYSFLGNVVMFIPIIWNHGLCFNAYADSMLKCDEVTTALWQIRSINGIIWDFKFNRIDMNHRIHFMLLYTHHNAIKVLSDAFELSLDAKLNKLMIHKTVDLDAMRNTVLFGDASDAPYSSQIPRAADSDDINRKYSIPHPLKSCTVDKLQEMLNSNDVLMRLSDQNSIEMQLWIKIIQNEIVMKRTGSVIKQNTIDRIFPKQMVPLTDYDALLVFDFALIHYEESPYNQSKTKIYKIPFIGATTVDNMILDVVYDTVSSLVYVTTANGNMYGVGLDGIRHRHIEWIEYRLCHTFKYINVNKIVLNRTIAFAFGRLSSHKLFILNTRDTDAFIPQYNGILDIATAKSHRLFNDEVMYSAYGYAMGGCIAKYQCIVPTQSMLDQAQIGFDCVSSILNVSNKLLVFVIADETRIRSLADSSLPELQIKGFETQTPTLSVAYITEHILLQITTHALLIIHRHDGALKEYCITHNHITYADIDAPFAAIIITKPLENYRELYLYRLSAQKMIELLYRVQLKHENISNIKIIITRGELFGVMVATYDGALNIYHYKSMTPVLSTSLNHLSFEQRHNENHIKTNTATEPKENIVAQSIVVMDDHQTQRLYIGTRNGWLIQYDLNCINTTTPILRNIGDLPVMLVPIQLNIDEQDEHPFNFTQFHGRNALLCISERCWILFHNKQHKLELWPLDYPPNAVSYAISFNQDGESYLLLIVNGCMDIVRVVLEPRLHCFYTKIGKTVTHLVNLQETNNLLYITKHNDTNTDSMCNDSMLHFMDKDALFYDPSQRTMVEYEAVLSDSIVTAIDVINHEENKESVTYLIALNAVFKRYFKQCVDPFIVVIKVRYDRHLKRFVKFSELSRCKFSVADESMKLSPMPYNIISFNVTRDVLNEIVAVSMGSNLLLFAIKEGCKLVQCGEAKLGDFVKDIIYDGTSGLLSILYEKNGVDIMNIRKKKSDELELELSNVIKSWNGVFYSSKHLLISCLREENNVRIETLICDRVGNVSFMTNVSDEDEKGQSDTNHILEHKCGLYLNNNGGCCLNQLIQCKLSHNKNDKCKIIAICSNGSLFEIRLTRNLM